MSYNAYNAWLSIAPSSPTNYYKEYFNKFVDNNFEYSTTIKTIFHNGNSITARVVGIFSKESPTKRIESIQKIIFKTTDYTVNIGDIFEFDGDKWLCTDVGGTPVSKSCSVTKCTNTLNLYQTGNLYQIPCIINSNVNLSTDENKYIEIPSTTLTLRIPNTEITRQIKRGEIYQIGLQNYEIVDINDIVEPGLLKMEVVYSQEEQIEHVYQLTILNGNSIQIAQSQSLTINCELIDNNEIVDSPTLLYSSSDETVAIISDTGEVTILGLGIVTFTVSMESDVSVKDSIVVEIVADVVNNYTYTIEGNFEIIKGYTQNYIAKKYNNGVLVEGVEFTFNVNPGTTPVSAYTLSIVDSDECSIAAISANYYITLRATDNFNNEFVEKQIRLKNIY